MTNTYCNYISFMLMLMAGDSFYGVWPLQDE